MKKFLMLPFLLIAALLFVSCGVDDIDDALAGSACETLDTFKCDDNILLKCEDYVWEKIKKCSGSKICNATKGICEETDENSDDNGDTDNNGNTNPGGNQGGDNGNTNPGGDNGDSGYNPDPSDSGDSGYNPPDNGDSGDSGYNPPDNGDSGDSGYNPPDNGDSGQNPPAPNQCTGLSIDWSSMVFLEGVYYADVEFGSSSYTDDFSIEFYQNEEGTASNGTYYLGTGDNANYATCTECVRAYQDYNESTDKYAKLFFQESGTLKITKGSSDGSLAGTLSAKLVEVTIDKNNDYLSTPVSGGDCVEIESGSFNYNAGGNDNPTTECTGLSIDWSSFLYFEEDEIAGYFADVEFGNASKSDDFSIEFCQNNTCDNTAKKGTYNLGSGANTNYRTCTECVMVYQDLTGNDYTKYFFQQSGTLQITKATTSNMGIAGTLSAKLVEVDIDANTLDSTPVSGGACVEIESGSFNYSGN